MTAMATAYNEATISGSAAKETSAKTIRVADDEEHIREPATLYLEKEGYSVVTAEDGEQALEMTRRREPDLVVLDVMMPKQDGLEVCRELRTPLTSIRGFTQALTDGTVEDPEQQQRSVQVIDDEARRMLRLVEQLLDLSRMEAGELRLRREAVDVRELTHHVPDVFQQRAEESGLTLTVTVDEDVPAIIGDYDRLVQMLTNLVANAVQHTTAAGSVALTAVADRGGAVLLGVNDTGAGIAPENLPRPFDRFYRAADGGPRRGTGRGLAISREIVRAHGGEIWAESRVSEGTSVRLRLPLHPPAGESSTQREANSSPELDGPAC